MLSAINFYLFFFPLKSTTANKQYSLEILKDDTYFNFWIY